MKIKKLITSTIIIASTVIISNNAFASDNKVYFKLGEKGGETYLYNLTKASIESYSITPDKKFYLNDFTYDTFVVAGGYPDSYMDFVVFGRKRSTTPVDFVKNVMGDAWNEKNAIYSGNSDDQLPQELNFAVQVNAVFTINGTQYACDNFIVAQGSNGAGKNNWWVFSNNNNLDQSITCNGSEELYVHNDGNSLSGNNFSLSTTK